MNKLNDDPRIDPRIKALMGSMPPANSKDVASREELLAEAGLTVNAIEERILELLKDKATGAKVYSI